MVKVIRPENTLFEDDVKIIDAEILAEISVPTPLPILEREMMQIFYNGKIFLPAKTNPEDNLPTMKIHSTKFVLEEKESAKKLEDDYFSRNAPEIEKIKAGFLERVVNGITSLGRNATASKKGGLNILGNELVKRIEEKDIVTQPQQQKYLGKDILSKISDESLFAEKLHGYERVMLVEGRLYNLSAVSEYISFFEKGMEPKFYKELCKRAESSSPKEISQYILLNKNNINGKVLPLLRSKIWHSERSSELFLDGTYWVTSFREDISQIESTYKKIIGKKIKIEAAGGIK